MRQVFADTSFWVALLDPSDQYHSIAVRALASISPVRLLTSDFVRLEVLNYFCSSQMVKKRVGDWARVLELSFSNRVVPASHEFFQDSLDLYLARIDKDWSLTDCSSFIVMKEHEVDTALTSDHHFEQAGFTILLK